MDAEQQARDFLDDPEKFQWDEIAGPIPMHFNALYGQLAALLRQTRAEAIGEAAETCRHLPDHTGRELADYIHALLWSDTGSSGQAMEKQARALKSEERDQ